MQETLTQEESAARRFPILPSNTNVTVIPIIPGIALFGYIRFLNASPVETRVDIYANGRRVAADLRYQHFTEYMKLFPGWYRIAIYRAGTVTNPLTVLRLQVQSGGIYTVAVTGLADALSTLTIEDSHRSSAPIGHISALCSFRRLPLPWMFTGMTAWCFPICAMRKSAATSPQLQAVTISSCARLTQAKSLWSIPK